MGGGYTATMTCCRERLTSIEATPISMETLVSVQSASKCGSIWSTICEVIACGDDGRDVDESGDVVSGEDAVGEVCGDSPLSIASIMGTGASPANCEIGAGTARGRSTTD